METLTKEQVMERIKSDHQWKINNLAIHLLGMPKRSRVSWLGKYEEIHGEVMTEELKSKILQLHAARKRSDPDA